MNDPDTGFDEWLAARGVPQQKERLVPEGARLGPWIVGGLLGRGGSGEVYHAERAASLTHAEFAESAEPMQSRVAIKVLHKSDSAAAARFRREAEILRDHPHSALPRLFGAGETPDGRPWMAVEELEKRELPHGDRDVARFLLALCGGVAHLHALGFVHRDVKPSNVLFRADGSPVLIDLGLAKHCAGPDASAAADASGPTILSIVDGKAVGVGTPGYAAPEQFAGGTVSPSSDVYALGVLADACFGHAPPRCWRALLRRATSALPAERFATAEAFARAIRRRHAPVAAAACAAAAVAAAVAAAAAFSLAPDVPVSPAAAAARALAEKLEAEAEPAWREVATYSVYDGRPFVRVHLEGRHVALARPLDLGEPQTVEIVGPGRLDAAIEGTPATLVSVRDAAVIDSTANHDPARNPHFRLGPGAFVALPNVLSVFPGDFAEPYDEPDPDNPKPGDRALRFSTAETSLGGQMALERACAADAAVAGADDGLVPAPALGAGLGWTNVVWSTGAANPWTVDPIERNVAVGAIEGGIGETTLAFDLDGGQNFTIFYEPCFPGRGDHGGRGAIFELACCGEVYHVDDRDGRPADGWRAIPIRLYPGRHHVTLRLRSDLWAPAGHDISVRFRVTPE